MKSAPRALTDDQVAAVESRARACLIIAPAGSGKTEVIIRRIIRILNESAGESFRVLAVAYTRKAAEELRQRVQTSVGEEVWRVDADTIHGFALDWLRRFGRPVGIAPEVVVYSDRTDRSDVLRRYFETLGELDISEHLLTQALDWIDSKRTTQSTEDPRAADLGAELAISLDELHDAYVQALEEAGGIDFPGMLTKLIELIEVDPSVAKRFRRTYRHVLVDEGQDLTEAQSRLIKTLVSEQLDLFVVADERQSINSWAGGGMEWARYLTGDEATQLQLVHNFRCAIKILDVAHKVAAHFARRRDEAITPKGAPPGEVQTRSAASESDEAEAVSDWIQNLLTEGLKDSAIVKGESQSVAPEEIAVIARARYLLDPTLQTLTTNGHRVSVLTDANDMLTTPEARLFHALLEVRANPNNRPAIRRASEELDYLLPDDSERVDAHLNASHYDHFRQAASGSPIATLIELPLIVDPLDDAQSFTKRFESLDFNSEDWASDVQRLTEWWRAHQASTRMQDRSLEGFLRYLFQIQQTRSDDPGIRLLTAHRAKGLEFRAVAVIGLCQGVFPDYRSLSTAAATDEERRAFYVAVTRASRALLLYWSEQRTSRYGYARAQEPSQFLVEADVLPQ